MQAATRYDRNYSIMLIAFISYDNCRITKASANAQQLGRLPGRLLYNVGGQDFYCTPRKTHKHGEGTRLGNAALIRSNVCVCF